MPCQKFQEFDPHVFVLVSITNLYLKASVPGWLFLQVRASSCINRTELVSIYHYYYDKSIYASHSKAEEYEWMDS